ncbi:unnamed protein product, partial [Taenia asiatica]|uniref:Uncharacterized protein n=1 Tax=Taenia asiatica TaxID=60517 RepID=A0A0R3W4P5_TAEAS
MTPRPGGRTGARTVTGTNQLFRCHGDEDIEEEEEEE